MKIALVHDFLMKLGGAERVLKVFADMYPDAPIHTLLYDEESVGKVFPKERVRTSFIQSKTFWRKHRLYTYQMPRAMEEFDFADYDVVLSSSSAYAHGILVETGTRHICYCHSPMRYAWDWTNEYRVENHINGWKTWLYAPLLKYLREWDFVASDRPDAYIANSKNVQKRILKYYKKHCDVIYPPVDLDRFKVNTKHSNYFLVVSTLTPYKRVDLAIQLFNKIGRKLVIIGDGPQRAFLESIAGDNIEFLGFQDDATVAEYMENCRAFVFPGVEDFGIAPVEAMACGKPVLAFEKGGLTESVIAGKTGEFFESPDVESMEDGLARLMYNERFYRADEIRRHAELFSRENFEKKIRKQIEKGAA